MYNNYIQNMWLNIVEGRQEVKMLTINPRISTQKKQITAVEPEFISQHPCQGVHNHL